MVGKLALRDGTGIRTHAISSLLPPQAGVQLNLSVQQEVEI